MRPLPYVFLAIAAANACLAAPPVEDEIAIDLAKPLATVVPQEALGAALDGLGRGEVDQYLTPQNIRDMRLAGLRRVTYRTRAELGIEVWHFTEEGSWSDAAHRQGYWTGSDNPRETPRVTWGYKLPRRGNTVDQANNQGYSRLDDGDPASFWKSNPYLDHRFTGVADRPQWIVITFDRPEPIDAARILWGQPFARRFAVQYWNGIDEFDKSGRWITFARGDRSIAGEPDEAVLRLSDRPVKARFVRILLKQSSETAPPGSHDVRDRLGYAVREVYFGRIRDDGRFADAMRRGTAEKRQTLVQVSSTDPWHRAADRDRDTEQPGLDFVFRSGLNGGVPMMVPVGVFYDTPENAAAEVRYIKRRGFPVRQIELGEEPDGQFISPEDFADLYLQTAKAVRAADPTLMLGGPSMQGAETITWPDPEGGRYWAGRFVSRLKARGGLDQLQFYSFEHYAFDEVCGPIGKILRDGTDVMAADMRITAEAGVPRTIPWYISEYGFSPFSGQAMSDVPSALYAANVVGQFLGLGGRAAFMYGYPPSEPMNELFPCAGYGGMMLFQADGDGRGRWPTPSYYAQRMMMLDWGTPAGKPHRLFAASSMLKDAKGRAMVAAYPLLGDGRQWSVMLINRDEERAHAVRLIFHNGRGPAAFDKGKPLAVVQYSPANYTWIAAGPKSHPGKDEPPNRFRWEAEHAIVLPALSLTVVRGDGPVP